MMSSHYVVIDGLRVRYATGGRQAGRPVLMTSPWPESLFAFTSIWSSLEDVAPLVAVDLPGFGQSEGRREILNPRAMGNFLIELVQKLSLDAPHAVCPDIGTPAILYAAAENPGFFTSLTVGQGAMDAKLVGGSLKQIVDAQDTKAMEGFDGGDLVMNGIPSLRVSPMTDEQQHDYRQSYAGARYVQSMAYVRTYPQSLPPLRALLGTIETPVLVLYGKEDPLVPPANAELLRDSLTHVRVVALDSGHFAWEDAAAEYGAAVRSWINGGYRDVV